VFNEKKNDRETQVVQGIGGGAIMPVSMAIVYRIVPREKIGLALGVWGMAAVCGPAVGPTLGGYIVDHLNWRFIFTMDIPIGVTGLILMPAAIVTTLMMPVSGFLFDRFGPKVLAVAGLTLTAWGTLEFHNLSLNTSNHSIADIYDSRAYALGKSFINLSSLRTRQFW